MKIMASEATRGYHQCYYSEQASFSSTSSSSSTTTSCSSISTTTATTYNQQLIATLRTTNHHITCLAVHNNLLYAASGSQVDIFDLTTYSILDTLTSPSSSGHIKSIIFTSEHNHNNEGESKKCRIFTAHQDSKIRVWRLSSSNSHHRLVTTLPTVKDKLQRFMIPENYVHVRRHKKQLWIEHNDAVSGLAVNKSQGLMYSVSWDKTLKIWRASDHKCLQSLVAHEDAVNAVAVSDDGETVYTASADGRIRVWGSYKEKDHGKGRRGSNYSLIESLGKKGSPSTMNAIALTCDSDGKIMLVAGGCDGELVVWDRGEGRGGGVDEYDYDDDDEIKQKKNMMEREVLKGHAGAVLCLVDIGHGLFASGSADRTVRIWGSSAGGRNVDEHSHRSDDNSCRYCCLMVLEGHKKPVRALAVVGDDEEEGVVLVSSGSLDGEIKIWQISYGFSVSG